MQVKLNFEQDKPRVFKHQSMGLGYHKLSINEKISIKHWAWETYSKGGSVIIFCLCFPDIIERFFNEY